MSLPYIPPMPRRNPAVFVAGLALFGLASFTAVSEPARAQKQDPDALLPADRAAALKRVAAQLFAESRYRDALAQYQAAYALQQEAVLLLLMARTYQHLGELHEARAFYVYYLTAAPAGPFELRSEAEQAIAHMEKLSPAPRPDLSQPSVALATSPVSVVTTPYQRAMRTTGITLFTIGYASSVLTGAVWLALMGPKCPWCWTMLVPGAGPVITASIKQSIPYGLPVLVLGAGPQLVGIGLWAGAYRHPETRVVPNEPQAQLAPLGNTGTGGLTMGVRF